MPTEPTSADEVDEDKDKDEDENTKEPIEVEDEDVGLLLPLPPPPPARFTSVWKAVTNNRKESLPGIKLAIFNTKSIFYFKLDEWQYKTILNLLPRKFKITQLQTVASYEKARQADCCP